MERYTSSKKLNTYSVNGQTIQLVVDFIHEQLPRILSYGDRSPSPQTTTLSPQTTTLSQNSTTPSPQTTPAAKTAQSQGATPAFSDEASMAIYGSEKSNIYKPINKYTQSRFPNDVQIVSFDLAYKEPVTEGQPRAIILQLKFGLSLEDNLLTIALQDNDARQKTQNIEEALLKRLAPMQNKNHLYYPNDFIPTLVFVIGFIIGMGAFMIENRLLRILCTVIFSGSMYFVAHRFIKNYSTFDTKRQKILNIILRWITVILAVFTGATVSWFAWKGMAGIPHK